MIASQDERRDLTVRGGRVVLASEIIAADVVIRNGRVAALAEPGVPVAQEELVVDASDRYVLPGGVDVHTHVALPFGDVATRDDFASASRAAALGGTTTFLEFAIPLEGESCVEAVRRRLSEAEGVTHVDYGFHGCITSVGDLDELGTQVEQLAELGVNTIKVFTAYRALVMLELGEVWAVMRAAAEAGLLVMVHAETESLVEGAGRDLVARGETQVRHQPLARPPRAELDAAVSVLRLASETRCSVYLVHVTLPEVADAIEQARHDGVDAHGESCPHYLLLDESCYSSDRAELFVCSPPIRRRAAAEGLWPRLGTALSGVHSDHCCFDIAQKTAHPGDLSRIPPGLPGIETRMPVMISEALHDAISLTDVVRLCAAEPARVFGLKGKGSLLPGYDADLVVVDPHAETEVAGGLHMETDFSPFDGWPLRGRIETVAARGRLVVRDGAWTDLAPRGRVLERDRLERHYPVGDVAGPGAVGRVAPW